MAITQTSFFYSTLGGDPDMAELVEMFVDEMPDRISTLQELMAAGDWEELGRFAHQMKGACGSYGFDQLTPLAERLEKSARNGDAEDVVQRWLAELVDGFGRTRPGVPDS